MEYGKLFYKLMKIQLTHREYMDLDTILKRISKIEEEILKLKIEILPEEIPKDEGFEEITKEEIDKNYKELKNKDFWGTEEELFKLLDE
ncbi:hypothetical protein [Methanocaldococcus sp.]